MNKKLTVCQKIIKDIFIFTFFGVVSFSSQVMAEVTLNPLHSFEKQDDWVRATDRELALQRGGFVLPNGVNINLSLEKTIFLNGVETFSSFFQLPENFSLLQNGNQNLTSDLGGSTLSSVIQNNLDNQAIKTINEFNIEVSNLQNLDLKGSQVFTDLILPNVR
tara:strand:- start:1415 stop:1903 length:489 start_codon:yes stop_codon:yes gene_type:complete